MSQSAPHERVIEQTTTALPSNQTGVWRCASRYTVAATPTACVRPDDWPDDDGPVTEIELWALRQMREVPHGQITFFKQDDEIVRCVKQVSEKP